MIGRLIPSRFRAAARLSRAFDRGLALAPCMVPAGVGTEDSSINPLERYFDSVSEGPGIWKWRHYFEVYHRHMERFRGRAPVVVEIGIYSGGSLPMWRDYFGADAVIHGIDIEPACRSYEADGIHVHIGDQADRAFWKAFRAKVPHVDILIDDGGHEPEQQSVSLEEMLPSMAPGSVYICEDIHNDRHAFADMVHGLSSALNASAGLTADERDPARRLVVQANPAQASLSSIHQYPFITVIEKRVSPLLELVAPKHGTQWQPFL